MKRSPYYEPDYAFGQAMLTLRTTLGLTQVSLAHLLGVSRKAVGKWEAGIAYPKTDHLKALLAIALKQQVFTTGHEEEEIRAFWKAAHQKVLLNESWFAALLAQSPAPPAPPPVEEQRRPVPVPPPSAGEPRIDWGQALDVPHFYGRQGEQTTLARWIVREHCRVVS